MRKLKIRDAYERLNMDAKIAETINDFIEATVLDSLDTDALDWAHGFKTTKQDFIELGKSVIQGCQDYLALTHETSFTMNYDAQCSFEYSQADETEVGLGAKGTISGVNFAKFNITGLYYVTADGSEIDLTDSAKVKAIIYRELKIV